jgi:hemolysin activation/secretion protein
VSPFFRLARIGGRDSLRAYRVDRFADLNAVAGNFEYRYAIWPRFMDAILFFDAGQVASKPDELSLSGLRTNWGLGFKVKMLRSALLRFDVGLGPEGARLYLSFSPEF